MLPAITSADNVDEIPPIIDDSQITLRPAEIERLRAYVDVWPKKTKPERIIIREKLIDTFLKDRAEDPQNLFARGFLRQVCTLGT